MRRCVVLAAAMAILVLMLVPGTATATAKVQMVGDRLNLMWPGEEIVMPADTPFHVIHGFCNPAELGKGSILKPTTRFVLRIDGRRIATGTLVNLRWDADCPYAKFNYHNFRAGLPAGEYVFEATWYYLGSAEIQTVTPVIFE